MKHPLVRLSELIDEAQEISDVMFADGVTVDRLMQVRVHGAGLIEECDRLLKTMNPPGAA